MGLAWHFGLSAATALTPAADTREERGRGKGMHDFAVFGRLTVASLAAGGLMNCSGGTPVEGWAAVDYAMIPFLALAGGALIWFVVSGRKGQAKVIQINRLLGRGNGEIGQGDESFRAAYRAGCVANR